MTVELPPAVDGALLLTVHPPSTNGSRTTIRPAMRA
jgi:hypothetical protein